jgi:hypothetical protein
MDRMLDKIRNSQLPSNMMQFAARGALMVPPGEMIEILVYLALHHKLFGEQARLTLAGWDEKASLAAAANPETSSEVLGYLVSPENLRPCLLPALAENPSVEEAALNQLAVLGSRSVVEVLLTSARVMNSPRLLQALQSNAHVRRNELAEIAKKPAAVEPSPAAEAGATEVDATEADTPDEIVESTVAKYLEENAAELAAEKDKPFQPIGISLEEVAAEETAEVAEVAQEPPPEIPAPTASVPPDTAASKPAPAAAAVLKPKTPFKPKKPPVSSEVSRDSTLQKISKLDIRGRITLAMRGNKEERSILIRDSTKLVSLAVLDSPKVSDGEVEKFALQKNVLEAVLRAIPMKRKYAKNYNIVRNLVQNPRTPLDLSLGLMKGLLIHDLKNLSGNKEVSDTIRKLALRMFKQKLEKKG